MINLSYAQALDTHCVPAGAMTGLITSNKPGIFLKFVILGLPILFSLLFLLLGIYQLRSYYKKPTLKAKYLCIFLLVGSLLFISFPLTIFYHQILHIYHQWSCPPNSIYRG